MERLVTMRLIWALFILSLALGLGTLASYLTGNEARRVCIANTIHLAGPPCWAD